MKHGKTAAGFAILGLVTGAGISVGYSQPDSAATPLVAVKPALSVNAIQPEMWQLPLILSGNGSIAAWQEAIIGAEVGDLHFSEVRAEVGEKVAKGQVLAVFADESVQADVAHSRAALAEAEANLAEARLNARRAERVIDSGAISAQQIDQYLTGEKTALAKLQSAKAQLDGQLLRLKYTKVLAGDDGVISSRSATLGAVAAKGQELFRLIRQNRLEWRAEVTASEIAQLKPGSKAAVTVPGVGTVEGAIRYLAPTLDVQNRNGLVYVDLPAAAAKGFRAGMFARGEFRLGVGNALTIPQEALSLREGFSYVFRLGDQSGDQAKVNQVKVELGRLSDGRQEILSGLKTEDRLVAAGATFLSDGDTVKVVKP